MEDKHHLLWGTICLNIKQEATITKRIANNEEKNCGSLIVLFIGGVSPMPR